MPYGLIGDWQRAAEASMQTLELRKQIMEGSAIRVRATGYGHWHLVWSGKYVEAEKEIKDSVAFVQKVGDVSALIGHLRELGLILGLQGKYKQAEECFAEELRGCLKSPSLAECKTSRH